MKTVLITGATGGIGEKICRALAGKYNLILVSWNKDKLKRLKNKLPGNVQMMSSDVSNYASLRKHYLKIKVLDVLINCAGVLGPVGRFEENNIKEWENTFKINFLGTVYNCKLLLEKLKKSKKGKIINFSGGGSAFPRKFHTAYGTSKTAVVRFTETLAVEYPELDINVIAPGAHKTKMWEDETHDKEPREWADSERLKKMIVFLCSAKSNGLTGRFLHINDVWGDWGEENLKNDFYKLRRVDERLLKKLK